MSKHLMSAGLALVLFAALTSFAQADAYVELVPTPLGPYFGGEDVHIDVRVSADTGSDEYVMLFQLAFYDTDAQIEVSEFEFNSGPLYVDYPQLPRPFAVYGASEPVPAFIWTLPADGRSRRFAQFEVTLPPAVGDDPLVLDVMNFDESDPDFTSRIRTYFGPVDYDWSAAEGNLHGGQLDFSTYVPEPGSLVLLAGGVFLALSGGRRWRA